MKEASTQHGMARVMVLLVLSGLQNTTISSFIQPKALTLFRAHHLDHLDQHHIRHRRLQRRRISGYSISRLSLRQDSLRPYNPSAAYELTVAGLLGPSTFPGK